MESMRAEFTRLAAMLGEKCDGQAVYYLPNSGNWGDALIRQGTRKFLQELGIEYTELGGLNESWEIQWGATLIYGGGGGWCRLWNHSIGILKRVHRLFRHVVVLPSTYELTYPLPNATFFCRDRYESRERMPQATFCHDLAFYLGRQSAAPGSGKGHFFRTDAESAHKGQIPAGNDDISLRGGHLWSTAPFIQAVADYAEIYTDRLHVAIAACLLRKRVNFYQGAYFKNKAVYLSSMRDHFENVRFCEERFG